MNATKYLSEGTYVVLPSKTTPRVYLAVGNKKTAKLSFTLYNPFSKKAKLLKAIAKFVFVHCNPLAKRILPIVQVNKSKFIKKLEKKLEKRLTSSVYIATDKEKFVLQLQDRNGIVGYLKYAFKAKGMERLINEKKAIKVCAGLDLVPEIILKSKYKKRPFILLENLNGSFGLPNRQEYKSILKSLEKDRSFKLRMHPRILSLKSKLAAYDLESLAHLLDKLVNSSENKYLEVYEHGDFAPWNLIRTEQGIVPFDFEYFEKNGLQYLDEIKYHFRIEHLLNNKNGMDLVEAVAVNVPIDEFKVLFQIFLIKEIIRIHEVKDNYGFELSLLNTLRSEEA